MPDGKPSVHPAFRYGPLALATAFLLLFIYLVHFWHGQLAQPEAVIAQEAVGKWRGSIFILVMCSIAFVIVLVSTLTGGIQLKDEE
jgi:hypothetical protein